MDKALNASNSSLPRRFPPGAIVLGLVLLFILALAGTFVFRMLTAPKGGFNMVGAVKTASVEVTTLPITYNTVGTLEANRSVDLNFEIAGVISRIFVKEGDWVRAGESLIMIDPDKQIADVAANRAALVQSQASLNVYRAEVRAADETVRSAQSRLNLARSEYQRYRDLWQKQFVATQALDERASALEVAQANLTSAMEQKTAAQARLDQASADISEAGARLNQSRFNRQDTLIKAPYSGQIGPKIVEIGDFVAPTEKVLTLVQADPLKITFQVPEEYLKQLRTGLTVTAKTDSMPNQPLSGQVVFVDPMVSPETRSIIVKAHIQNGTHQLKPGQFSRVDIILGEKPHAMTIPEEALIPQGERYFVYVVRKAKGPDGKMTDTAFFKQVQVGMRLPGRVEILEGISTEDRVVIAGIQKLQDKMPVKILPADPESGAAATDKEI